MSHIFICYSRQSQTIVRVLARDIESLGQNVWFDEELTGGQNWWDQILEKICKSDIFIFAISQDALDSPACKLELKYASDLRKIILPIMVIDSVSINLLPPILSVIQHVDYQQQDKQAYKSLDKAIKALPAPKAIPDPLPKPPEAPISYLSKLKGQIEITRTLSFKEQTELILKLEESLNESNDIDDVRNLLKLLRKRKDLLVKVAKKIDSLLISEKEALPERMTSHTYEEDIRSTNSLIWLLPSILIPIIVVITLFAIKQSNHNAEMLTTINGKNKPYLEARSVTTGKEAENTKWTIQIISYSDTKEHIVMAKDLAKAMKNMTNNNTFVAKRGDEIVVCTGKFNSRDSNEMKQALEEIREIEYEGEKDFASSYPIQVR